MLGILQPIFGAMVILGIGYSFSTDRRAINWTTVAWGLGLQVVFAFIVLKTTIGQTVFETVGGYITRLLGFAGVGLIIIPEGGHNEVGIDLISGKIRTQLQNELSSHGSGHTDRA